jgi:CRISPR system Cascade subunit CasD
VLSGGDLLRDYHTAQVPGRSDLRGRPHRTRRDELAIQKTDLNTILSTRDYRQNGNWLVAIVATPGSRWSLPELSDALARPRYVLYLGRKSCPLAAPLAARIFPLENALAAFRGWLAATGDSVEIERIVWGDGMNAGVAPHLSVPRKDRMISRKGWQFGDRIEHSHLVGG